MGVKEKMTAIADAIRDKTGGTEKLSLAAMADGIDAVYAKGRQAEYDAFWDTYQRRGERANYQYAFSYIGWTDSLFKPKYDMILAAGYSGQGVFQYCHISNIAEVLEKQGVKLDTTNCGYLENMFAHSHTIRVPELNCSHAMDYTSYGLAYTFANSKVETIDKLIVPEELKYFNTFLNCSSLKNITFEGTIGNSISLADSPLLTNASVQSIVDCLKDLTGATAQTLTLHATVGAKLTDAQKATITAKNWTLVY